MSRLFHYQHFSEEERESLTSTILRFIIQGRALTCSALAEEMKRSRKTIRKEITRGRDTSLPFESLARMYNPVTARKDALAARSKSRPYGKQNPRLLGILREGICNTNHSPEQIVHTSAINAGYSVSVSTVYSWLGKKGPLNDCRSNLRFRGKRKKNGDLRITSRFRNAKGLEDRAPGCNNRTEFGHLEADTVVSCRNKDGSSACLFTFVDRKTRYMFAYWAESCTALSFSRILPRLVSSFPQGAIKSITADRGTEFSDWELMERVHGIPMYFCRPHHPWEKGSNENMNGRIRQYFPKGTNFSDTCQSEINRCCLKFLRNRPMKSLGYKTPKELFKMECSQFQ